MQQINVCGCRGYLDHVASNQSFQLLSTVIIRVPFKSAMIQFKYSEPSTLRSICTTSDNLCMMVLLFYSSVHLPEQVADIFTKVFCENTFSNLKSLLIISDHALKHDWWQDFQILFFLSMFKGGFSQWVFASLLGCMDMQYVKGLLRLVARPYNFMIFTHKLKLNGGVTIINP